MIVESDAKYDRVSLTTEYYMKVDDKREVRVVPDYLPVAQAGIVCAETGPQIEDRRVLPVYSGRVIYIGGDEGTVAEDGSARLRFLRSERLGEVVRGNRSYLEFHWKGKVWQLQRESDGGSVHLNAAKERVVETSSLVRVYRSDTEDFKLSLNDREIAEMLTVLGACLAFSGMLIRASEKINKHPDAEVVHAKNLTQIKFDLYGHRGWGTGIY